MHGIFETDEPHKQAPREFFKTFDPSIKENDLVVVETGTRHHASVVKIVAVDVPPVFTSSAQARWIIQRVDSADYQKLRAMEDQAVAAVKDAELRKERSDLKKTMLGDFGDTLNALPIVNQVAVNGGVHLLEATPAPQPAKV